MILLPISDCWDGPDGEPVVYHGWTLTSKLDLGPDHLISFRRTMYDYDRTTVEQNSDLLQIFHPMTAILNTALYYDWLKKFIRSGLRHTVVRSHDSTMEGD